MQLAPINKGNHVVGKLKSLSPRLIPLGNRLSPPRMATREEQEAARLRQRDKATPWRKWYYTSRWKKLRQEVLIRDNYTCQKTGVICGGYYPSDTSPVIDHIKPHRGDKALFWDAANLQTVSKGYHDSIKQREERGSGGW